MMTWWDYGYWVIREAQRVPTSNPTQTGAARAARLFLAQSEQEAMRQLERAGSRYVLVDESLLARAVEGEGLVVGKFPALPLWALQNRNRYYEVLHRQLDSGDLEPQVVFFPDYYRTMAVRLYVYHGEAYEPEGTSVVVSYEAAVRPDGSAYWLITDESRFSTYAEAVTYHAEQNAEHVRVGTDPESSGVPLERLESLALVHRSPFQPNVGGSQPHGQVEVFEVIQAQ